jgi:hypothetical protein
MTSNPELLIGPGRPERASDTSDNPSRARARMAWLRLPRFAGSHCEHSRTFARRVARRLRGDFSRLRAHSHAR